MKLDASYHGTASVQDIVSGARLDSTGFIAGGRYITVTAEIGVKIIFKVLFLSGSSVIPYILVAFRYFTR